MVAADLKRPMTASRPNWIFVPGDQDRRIEKQGGRSEPRYPLAARPWPDVKPKVLNGFIHVWMLTRRVSSQSTGPITVRSHRSFRLIAETERPARRSMGRIFC